MESDLNDDLNSKQACGTRILTAMLQVSVLCVRSEGLVGRSGRLIYPASDGYSVCRCQMSRGITASYGFSGPVFISWPSRCIVELGIPKPTKLYVHLGLPTTESPTNTL